MTLRSVIVMSAAGLALVAGALGQDTSRTFHLTTVPNLAGLREIATIIRTLDVGAIALDEEKQDITVNGTAGELALAAWLVHQLDSKNPPPAPPKYTFTDSDDDSVRIFYLTYAPAPAPLNELVTTLRTVGDVQRIFTYSPRHAIAIRTTAEKAHLAEWLVRQMDVSPNSHAGMRRYGFSTEACADGVAEVALLATPQSPAGLNQIVTVLRTVADVQHIFTHSGAPQGVAFRGCASQVQLADWLVQQLDSQKPPPTPPKYTFTGSEDDSARIFYLTYAPAPAQLNELVTTLRTVADVQRIFTYSPRHAIAIRTTAEKAQLAEWLVRQMDVSPDSRASTERHGFSIEGCSDGVAEVALLATPQTPAGLNQIVTVLRTLADVQHIFTHSGAPQGVAFRGCAPQVQLADWLVQQLDSQSPPPTPPKYTFTGSDDDSVRIFYLTYAPAPVQLNELVTTLRTVADVQRIFTYSPRHAIAIRTTAEKAQLAEWLVRQMDVSPDSHASTERYTFSFPRCAGGVVEVAYLKHPLEGPGLNEVVTTLRLVADIQAIFTHSSAPQGVAFRGCAPQVQLADWLFQQIDAQPDAQVRAQKHEYPVPDSADSIARVYYLSIGGQQALNGVVTAIRSEVELSRIFFCTEPAVVALRASPGVVAAADRIIKERDPAAVP